MRHVHYLKPATGYNIPSQVVCVDCSWVKNQDEANANSWRVGLMYGYLCRFRWRDSKPIGWLQREFNTVDEFWDAIRTIAKDGTLTWLFAYRLKDAAAALGMWDLFLDGKATITGTDPRERIEHENKGRKPWSGYCVLEDPPSIIQFRFTDGGGTVKAVDVRNYGVGGWQEIATSVGAEWLAEYEVDPDPFNERVAVMARSRALADWVSKWIGLIERNKWGSMANTLASQAATLYKTKHLAARILIHSDEHALAHERQSFYGGRCEARFLGRVTGQGVQLTDPDVQLAERGLFKVRGGIYHYDVNSLYAAVAKDAWVPVRLISSPQAAATRLAGRPSEALGTIATVLVETKTPCVPCRIGEDAKGDPVYFPLADPTATVPHKTLTIYPVGRFVTTLCGPELDLLWKHGHIVQWGCTHAYECEQIFRTYVDELYTMRLEAQARGDVLAGRQAKGLLNSLWGKWVQRARLWKWQPGETSMEPFRAWWQINKETRELEQWRSFAWRVEKLVDVGEHSQSVPAIGAWINSLARVRLWELIQTAGYDNTYYWDTDSLFVNRLGHEKLVDANLVDESRLGGLRLVGHYDTVEFRGFKYYVTPERVVCAGLSDDCEAKKAGTIELTYKRSVMADLWNGQAPQARQIKGILPIPAEYKHGKRMRDGTVVPYYIFDRPEENS